MIQLNYPEMLQDIKMSIFSGDHSGIYSLAGAVACIAASFSLITWYNKMMNDPFGRLDVRSVVRTVMVLFLTCNFYSFVLMPLDGITHTVAKAITASVDSDRDGVFGKINESYAAVEEHDKESLTGQFEEEMGRESSSTDLDGLSYETSASKNSRQASNDAISAAGNTFGGLVGDLASTVLRTGASIARSVSGEVSVSVVSGYEFYLAKSERK